MPLTHPPSELSTAEELGQSLKRCRPEVVAAAIEFRESKNPALLPLIVTGVIERFVEPERRHMLRTERENLKLSEDLGLDSLTLMEIVLLTEEVFHINISGDEMHHLCTVGEINRFIATKV